MFNSIKSKLALFSVLGFVAVAVTVSVSYFIAVYEIKSIMQSDVGAVADALEKSISYIATLKPDAYKDKDFKQFIYNVKIGKSGYAFMLDDQGTLVIHQKDEGKNLAGLPHIDYIRTHKQGGFYDYRASTTGQDKIVAYRYIQPWGLWIVPGVNKEDYFNQLKENFLKWNVACAILTILLLSSAGFYIIRSISVPIRSAVDVADRLATGDLTIEFNGQGVATGGEIGALHDAQRTMVTSLNTMVNRINSSAEELSAISGNIAESTRQVIAAAGQQSAAVDETAQAVDAINLSVSEVTQGVDSLSLSATETSSATLEMAANVEEVAINMENLAKAVEEVSSSITEMATSVKQIGSSVQGLVEISSTTASSIAQMDTSIRHVGENASSTAEIVRHVLLEAEAGRESVQATIAGISEIRNASRTTADVIHELSASAVDISAILRVIDEVTVQTNLLALNAAIIAAQAGEHGKGFAIVADEIKQLADRTKESTREIANVIARVLEKTDLAVKTIAVSRQSIESGADLSRHAGEVLDTIYSRVKSSSSQVEEIASATVEQSKGSHMISRAMENLAEMIVQIRNATREQERGSELIMAAVERMKGMNDHVRYSTLEQSKASKEIAFSTEKMTGMILQIKQACTRQSDCSGRIAEAMEQIFLAAGVNMQATEALNEAVSGLVDQVGNLQQETGEFRTTAVPAKG